MTSTNVRLACDNANLVAPCIAPPGCEDSDNYCVTTSLNDCNSPMRDVSKAILMGQIRGVVLLLMEFMHIWQICLQVLLAVLKDHHIVAMETITPIGMHYALQEKVSNV